MSKNKLIVAFCLIIYDIFVCCGSYFLGLLLRFDMSWNSVPLQYFEPYRRFVPIYIVAVPLIFFGMQLYSSIWKYASYNEFVKCILASAIAGGFHTVVITLAFARMPISYYVIGIVFQTGFVLVSRFSYRILSLIGTSTPKGGANIMVIGAGDAGQLLIRDVNRAQESQGRAVCIIDDDRDKWKRNIDGVPVVGGRDSIIENVVKYDIKRIYIAIPSATHAERQAILDICKETGCELKTIPAMWQIANGEVNVKKMRDVDVEDLLGRETAEVFAPEVFDSISGKTVLVTGGGGSIGSELVRQIAALSPGRLVVFDIYENNVYDLQHEIGRDYPDVELIARIGSVRDERRLANVFNKYEPEIVFHAAAHKHVPLMEGSPCEAIKNNALGTLKTARAAINSGVKKFVLISTDKAVNPTNIMGASKRLCEMIIQAMGRMSDTRFVAVRFGNVLGSNGSVIPLFRKQIAEGGPVTVTHREMIRYFMTIPEAVSLVLRASIMGEGGEIFVLDMGSPVKIDTLAKNLIKLSGFVPGEDIKIVYTGLRPGEKLYEEKLMAEEGLSKTANDMIFIGKPLEYDDEKFFAGLKELEEAAFVGDEERVINLTAKITGTYTPDRGK